MSQDEPRCGSAGRRLEEVQPLVPGRRRPIELGEVVDEHPHLLGEVPARRIDGVDAPTRREPP